jgi:chemotaxis protein MotA
MLALIGIIVVFGAIVGGYLMEKGNMLVLLQPAELLIIGGAALGTLLVANPLHTLLQILKAVPAVLRGSPYTKASFLENLKLLYDLFSHIRKTDMAAVEADVEDPGKSAFFSKYPKFLSNHHLRDFVCDTLRSHTSGTVSAFDLDQVMEADLDVHHHQQNAAVKALSTVADSLPGLGIVAAVLGVIVTMGSLGGPPEEIGHKVAAALVGTFLGILLCYGLLGPVASNMGRINEAEGQFFQVMRQGLVAFLKGAAPIIAVEFARRNIPAHVRPTYREMDAVCRKSAA